MGYNNNPVYRPFPNAGYILRGYVSQSQVEAETRTYLGLPDVGLTWAQADAIDANIKLIKYSTGVTFSSVTGRFSYPSGGPFFFEPTSIDLRYLAGMDAIITVNDGSKTFTFYPGSLGTGETLSLTEKCTDPGFDNAGSWTAETGTAVTGGFGVFTNVTSKSIYQATTATVGALYKNTGDLVIISGSACLRYANLDGITRTVSGTYADYMTATTTNFSLTTKGITSFTGTIDNRSTKQVLTGSTSSLLAFSDRAKTTPGATVQAGFNPNTVYTVTVTHP